MALFAHEDFDNLLKFRTLKSLTRKSIKYENRLFSANSLDFALIKQYLNLTESVLVKRLVKAIMFLPRLEKPTASSLGKLITAVSKVIQELKRIEEWTDDWNLVLIHVACCRLDTASRNEWTSCAVKSSKVKDFINFLKKKAALLSSCIPTI